MARKRPPPTKDEARRRAERERAFGLDSNDEAARWLEEHDPKPPLAPPKRPFKSKVLHQWRQRQLRDKR